MHGSSKVKRISRKGKPDFDSTETDILLIQVNTVEPPVSDHLKYQALVVAYGRWSRTRAQITLGKVNFEKKSSASHREISVSCTIRECDNVTTNYYPVSALLSVK